MNSYINGMSIWTGKCESERNITGKRTVPLSVTGEVSHCFTALREAFAKEHDDKVKVNAERKVQDAEDVMRLHAKDCTARLKDLYNSSKRKEHQHSRRQKRRVIASTRGFNVCNA